MARRSGVLEVKPRGAEWLLWLVVYVVVHVTLDVTLAVAVASATGGSSWVMAVFALNVLLGFLAAQAVVGLLHTLRDAPGGR